MVNAGKVKAVTDTTLIIDRGMGHTVILRRDPASTTPLQWLCRERVRRAQDLLENTDDTIEYCDRQSILDGAKLRPAQLDFTTRKGGVRECSFNSGCVRNGRLLGESHRLNP